MNRISLSFVVPLTSRFHHQSNYFVLFKRKLNINCSKLSEKSLLRLTTVFKVIYRSVSTESTGGISKEIHLKKNELIYPEQNIEVFTCENLYKQWRKFNRFKKIPESGVTMNIAYVDTSVAEKDDDRADINAPVVLCVHGIPGSYAVFSSLIQYLGKRRIRVLVPTFPDSLYFPGIQKRELFRHSVEEKAQVLRDFLKKLNISKVACIVSHSSAIYPCLRLALDKSDVSVKSQAFFNTGGHRATQAMKPYWIMKLFSKLYLSAFGQDIVRKAGSLVMKYFLRSSLSTENMHGILLLTVTMVYSEFETSAVQFKEIRRRKFPTLLSFSEDDKVVESKLTYDVINLLGINKSDIWYYDKDGCLKSKGAENIWAKVMSFEFGSHYVFRKYQDLNNEALFDLIKSVIED